MTSTSLNDDRIMGCDYNDKRIDDDYFVFLKYLINGDVSKINAVEKGIREEEKEEGEEDPHFKMFMENLRADGKSYVLRVCKIDGGFGFLKYEDPFVSDYESDCESDRGNLRKLKEGIRREKLERKNGFGGVERRGNVEDSESLSLRSDDEHACFRSHKNLSSCTDDEKIEGTARIAQSWDNVERSMLPKEKRSSGFQRRQDAGTSMRFRQKEGENIIQSTGSGENLKCVPGKDKRDSAVLENSRTTAENEKIEGRVRDVKSRDNVEKKNSFIDKDGENSAEIESLRSEHLSNVSCKRKRSLSERVSPLDNDICQHQLKCDKEDGSFDPCFKLFLNHCVTEGDSLVFVYNGKRLKYEEDDVKSSSDSEIMVLDKAPDCMEWNYTPIIDSKVLNAPMEEDDLQCLGGLSKMENPKFRKEVIDILRRPYNKEEYKKLQQDVKSRKPIEGHLELRGGSKRFLKDTMGKSYLDHYLDLQRQLDAFKGDQPKELNILRGFFYYLENMADDGKFKPWLDESCLAIEPRCD